MKKILAVLITMCLEASAFGIADISSMLQKNNSDPLYNFGSVTAFENFDSPSSAVIVQDLHCHPQVQRNISEILTRLYESYNVQNIFMEGAYGEIDFSWMKIFSDKTFADATVDALLKDGKLTGGEYFAYQKDVNGILKGMENKNIHEKNLERLAFIIKEKPAITEILSEMGKDLKGEQKMYYSAFNKKLARLTKDYKEGKLDSQEYYRALFTMSKKLSDRRGVISDFHIDINQYKNISEYISYDKNAKSINIRKVQKELVESLSVLKETLSYQQYAQLRQNTDSFNDTNTLINELIGFENSGISCLEGFNELQKYISVSGFSENMNAMDLLYEEHSLLRSLQLAGAKSGREAVLVILSDLFDNICSYYTANLTSAGYLYLNSFGLQRFKSYWKANVSPQYVNMLDTYDNIVKEYYEANLLRDKVFSGYVMPSIPKKTRPKTKIPSKNIEDILGGLKDVDIIVCGGFHTQGLIDEMREKGISYAVITPDVHAGVDKAAAVYERLLLEWEAFRSTAIQLQSISQEPEKTRVASILETLLRQELERNPKADIVKFMNDAVNQICAVNEQEIIKRGIKNYKKPENKGIVINDGGTVTVNISFGGTGGFESIVINRPQKTGLYGSAIETLYAEMSALQEWLYRLPGAFAHEAKKFFTGILSEKTYAGKIEDGYGGRNRNISIYEFSTGGNFDGASYSGAVTKLAAAYAQKNPSEAADAANGLIVLMKESDISAGNAASIRFSVSGFIDILCAS